MYAKILKGAPLGNCNAIGGKKGGCGKGKRSDSSQAGENTDALPSLMSKLSVPDGGFTYDMKTGTERTTGYALSPYPEYSFAKKASELTINDVKDYISKNKEMLLKPEHYMGTWNDPDTGLVFLDVSIVASTSSKAKKLCEQHDQKSYFDFKEGKSVKVNDKATSGGVIKSDKPAPSNVYLIEGKDAFNADMIAKLFTALTGKVPTKEEIARVHAELNP